MPEDGDASAEPDCVDSLLTSQSAADPSHSPPKRNWFLRLIFPYIFERQAKLAFLWPRFNSSKIEAQYKISCHTTAVIRFRVAMFYLCLVLLLWSGYMFFQGWNILMPIITLVCSLFYLILGLLTLKAGILTPVSLAYVRYLACLPLFVVPWLIVVKSGSTLFSSSMLLFIFIVILTAYTAFDVPILAMFIGGLLHAISYEAVYFVIHPDYDMLSPTRVAMLLCVHAFGFHFSHCYTSRLRSLYLKVGRAIVQAKAFAKETRTKENLILSIMPRSMASKLLGRTEPGDAVVRQLRRMEQTDNTRSKFRDLRVEVQTDVSILFADIVGFTNMSSGKTAVELVDLLNDLYGRFDDLTEKLGCEKIATLGDCYYCVSGCPTPRPDHAKCCIEMGLAMIDTISQFDKDRQQSVRMRVGIHTGRVISGIIGEKRYKFDVLSTDVFVANEMESSGSPSCVHISQNTLQSIKKNNPEEAERVFNFKENTQAKLSETCAKMKTYFVHRNVETGEDSQPAETTPLTNGTRKRKRKSKTENIEDTEDLGFNAALTQKRMGDINIYRTENLSLVTLRFKEPIIERAYYRFFLAKQQEELSSQRLKCTACIYDSFYTFGFFCILAAVVFSVPLSHQIVRFPIFVLTALILVFIVGMYLMLAHSPHTSWKTSVMRCMFNYLASHAIGATMLLVPLSLLASNMQCYEVREEQTLALSISFFVVILHFMNYPRLSVWVKTILGAVACILLLLLSCFGICEYTGSNTVVKSRESNWSTSSNISSTVQYSSRYNLFWDFPDFWELTLDVVILILFVWLMNIDFEFIVRANFYADTEAEAHKNEMESMKHQADLQLRNILPSFVADQFQKTDKKEYSQSRTNVGIIFFFIDFWSHYSEDYRDGSEYIRLLNELISDFDELLNNPKYCCIEKIKTIQSTYMAASNLNPANDTKPWDEQLFRLMEFTAELKKKLFEFCQEIPGFDRTTGTGYKFKAGFNHGDVTSGVIGTSKLHFDIWGDAVNISSRMYSTSENGRIQMTEKSKLELERNPRWGPECFEQRAKVFVKGKGEMMTYYFHEPNSDEAKANLSASDAGIAVDAAAEGESAA